VSSLTISRRNLLLAALAGAGCGRRKATAYRGYCFVANQQGRTVAAVDLSHFRVRKQIVLDAEPSTVIAHPSAPKVFVLAPDTGTIYEIDATTLSVTRRARAGNTAAGVLLSPDKDALWVLYRDPASLVEFPLQSLRQRRHVRLPSAPDGFDLSTKKQAAVISTVAHSLTFIATPDGSIQRTVPAGVEPVLVRFQSDGRQLIVGSRAERNLSIFETAYGRVVVRLPLPIEPRNFCTKPDGGELFVSGDGMDAVVILYPYSTEIAETMLAGHAPGSMAVTDSAASSFLLVSNPQANSVTVLDYDNTGRKLVAVVNVGQEPGSIVITPDQQYALVLNQKSGDLAVIRIYELTNQTPARRYKPTPLFTMIPVGEGPVSAAVVAFT
jgi:DNA-binding beta-propeller fold protein YncE